MAILRHQIEDLDILALFIWFFCVCGVVGGGGGWRSYVISIWYIASVKGQSYPKSQFDGSLHLRLENCGSLLTLFVSFVDGF